MAKQAGLHVVATAGSVDLDYVRGLGADTVVDYKTERFEESVGGILVSVVSPVPEATQTRYGIRAAYFYVDVTTARLNKITELFESASSSPMWGLCSLWKTLALPTRCLAARRISAARSY